MNILKGEKIMQQNISLFQIRNGLYKMLCQEYKGLTNDMVNLIVDLLGDTNWLDYSLKETKTLIETYLLMYLKDDYLPIIYDQYSGIYSKYGALVQFKQDLIEIVDHLCWAQWLYLK